MNKEAVLAVLRSKAFKAAVLALAAAVTAWASSCTPARPAEAAKVLSALECKARVLAPYVGDAAEDLVREIDGNRAFDVGSFLQRQGLTSDQVLDLAVQFYRCVDPEAELVPAPLNPVSI